MKMSTVRNFFSTSQWYFPADLTRSVYCHLLFHCLYSPYLVLVFVFKFNCSLRNRYFWRCMLEHTKRQVHKWKFLQHALFSYVNNHSLFDIFTQVRMVDEQIFHGLLNTFFLICFKCFPSTFAEKQLLWTSSHLEKSRSSKMTPLH